MKPPNWLIFGLIVLSVLMAGGLLGSWMLGPTQPGEEGRWGMIALFSLGTFFVVFMLIPRLVGLIGRLADPRIRTWQEDRADIPRLIFLVLLAAYYIARCVHG